MQRISLNGVLVYPFSSVNELMEYVANQKQILVAINAEKVVMASDQTRAIINSNIGYCDGMGAVKALRQLGRKSVVKIAGCELWLELIHKYHATKSFYLIGGKQKIIEETVTSLKEQYPNLQIKGYRNGFLNSNDEREALINDVAEKKPDVVFVAMGSPKQELLMCDMQKRHQAIYQGLGGSFDVYTGHVKRAPKWWLNHNLEFLYRVLVQPKRISRQWHYIKFAAWLYSGRFKREQKHLANQHS